MATQLQTLEINSHNASGIESPVTTERVFNHKKLQNKSQPIRHGHHKRFRRTRVARRKKKRLKLKKRKLKRLRSKKQKSKKQKQKFSNRNPGSFFLVHIKRTKNNTVSSLSNLFGNQRTLWTIRGGQISPGGPKGRRKTRYTQRLLFKSVVKKLLGFGAKHLVIQVKGFTASKRYIFKHFMKRRFKIVMFKDMTGIAHNGCRAPKARRV